MTISILTPMRHAVEGGASGLIAAPQVPSIDEWNALVRAYLEARFADETEMKLGALAKAERAHDEAVAAYGGDVSKVDNRTVPSLKAAHEAYMAAEEAHSVNFSRPRWEAARAVMRAPAPTLAALVQKIEVMEGEGWDGNETEARDDFAALAADIRRLAGA